MKCDAKVAWKTHSVYIDLANNRTFILFIADTLCVSTGEEINMCRSLGPESTNPYIMSQCREDATTHFDTLFMIYGCIFFTYFMVVV